MLSPLLHLEIRQHHLFKRFSGVSFERILQHSGLLSLSKNEILFECGLEASHFFLIRSGQIIFFQTSSIGNEKIVGIFESGQIFAEAIMFTEDQCYPVNARATCDTELFYFNAQEFKTQLRKSSELCFSMMSEISSRLNAQTQEIIELSIYDAQHRLVRYLLEKSCKKNNQSSRPVVILSTTKYLLASRLSITPETLSRTLARLKKQGLIKIKDDVIILIEPQKLRALIGYCDSKITKKPGLKSKLHEQVSLLSQL